MSIARKFLFLVVFVIILGLPVATEAMRPCIELWGQGKHYNKFIMKRCDLEFQKLTYDAITSLPQ